ncbi:uncharacterized protein LOC135488433 [Lineus longissimus]|uniref:uncharacterized protein LOC135488433 n=1 Tax=Lineus longissimus TaxID=88925 RepID=UPI002B4CEBB2
MDIGGGNLEALAEEDAENENWDVESEDSDDGLDGGIRAQEPNKFDSLCDGVLNAMALVHAGLSEFLEFKDEILVHSLPPNVLLRMGLVSGKVFRSVSDLHMPMNELIRMVRVYSTPWEEKSAALKKLHEDYENKQRQLGIAVRRLQMIDTNAKRNAKERRIMNWEKLFAKMTSAKGHGRRWKFMIKTFKDKAKDGFEHVKEYVDGLSDDEGESEDDHLLEDLETTCADKNVQILDMNALSDSSSFHSDEEEAEAMSIAGSRDIQSGSSHKRVHFDEESAPEMITIKKPEMEDKGTWTNEPEFDRCLNFRVHKPQGLDVRDIKCVVTYGKRYFKTNNLDIRVDIEELRKTMVKPVDKDSPAPKKGGRLIGTRGKTHAAMKAERDKELQDRDADRQRLEEEKRRLEERGLSEDFELTVADELPKGVSEDLAPHVDPLRIAVHHGNKEELIAMATIELEDLESCDLPIYYKDSPVGDDPFPEDPAQKSYVSFAEDSGLDDELRSETSSTTGRPQVNSDGVHLKFPLYTVKGRGDAAHQPVGQIPLTLKWGKMLRPKTFNRTSETMTVNELVHDLTGIDLDITSKEDIMKPPSEKTERALSAIDIPVPTPTPEPVEEVEEMVLKSEYNEMVGKYDQQMQLLQEEYESRLQELAESIESMQLQAQDVLLQEGMKTATPESIHGRHSSQFSRSPSAPFKPVRIRRAPQPPSEPAQQGNRKNFKIGRPLPKWGETLPGDFFERLKLFNEESELHRQEIAEKRQQEVYDDNEKKLTAEFKIAKPGEEEYNEMQDVSLPALFMPMRNGAGVYNPRAHQYFQASGSTGVRLTQPPSMMMLPPIPNHKLSVVNLFDISNNFTRSGSDWLMQRFVQDQGRRKDGTPQTPAPTVAGKRANMAKSAEVVIGERTIEMKPVPPLQEVEKGPSR